MEFRLVDGVAECRLLGWSGRVWVGGVECLSVCWRLSGSWSLRGGEGNLFISYAPF